MSKDWTAGYVAEIGYTFGYYQELNPLRVNLALLNAGIKPPVIHHACELGFGQGLSINLHAAASETTWYGTDFNPAQTGFAQELADKSGAKARLYDQAFAQFCQREDLPEFDFISLHGIWSWISDENRQVIVDFIERKLKVGGVLYISYNTQPGWAPMVPVRELLTEHTQVLGASGHAITGRIDAAIEFAAQLLDTNPVFARANPTVVDKINQLKTQNRHYLAHEYFNRDWAPMSFAKMADWLAPAKLQFACSANYADAVDVLHLSPAQLELLNTLPEGNYRQMVRDFMVNQQFRKDYWIKGARTLTPLQRVQALGEQSVMLTKLEQDIELKINGSLGEANLTAEVYQPLMALMGDFKPRTLAQIEQALPALNFTQILQAVMILISKEAMLPVNTEAKKAKKSTDLLNQHFGQLAQSSNELAYMGSPVTGGGVNIPRFDQLFIQAYHLGHKTPQDWAQYVWQWLAKQGQRLVKEGKAVETEEENLAMLLEQAEKLKQQWPRLKALGLV